MQNPPSSRRGGAWFAVFAGAAVAALALALYYPTLGASFAYDDIDYLNDVARVMAGQSGFWETLFQPQGEHLIAGMRLALHANAELFGTDATPFRLLALAAHGGAALWLALLARRAAGSAAAGLATALTYVGACGFSSMWIWFPSGASVPFGLFFLTGGLVALAYAEALGRRRALLLAAAGLVLCLLCETTLAPLAALPIAYDLADGWRAGRRRPSPFALFAGLAALGAAAATTLLFSARFGPRMSIDVAEGVPRAAFLLLVSPFRLLFPGIPIGASSAGWHTAMVGVLLGAAAGALLLALLVALWHRRVPRLALLAALMSVGPLGVLGLVGLGRWRTSYAELYDADRYFFTLLIPVSLLAGALAGTAAERLRAWPRRGRSLFLLCLLAAAAAELVLHRRAMLRRIPFDIYGYHQKRFDQLESLSRRVTSAARQLPAESGPLRFPEGAFYFPDVHNGFLSVPFFLEIVGHGAGDRLGLGGVGERDAAILNPLLDEWAAEIGERPPFMRVVEGRLENARRVTLVDFRTAAFGDNVLSGFFDWEQPYRWMGKRGSLRLTLVPRELHFLVAAPISDLRRADPGFRGLELAVAAEDEATGTSVPLGLCVVAADGVQPCAVDGTPFLARFGNGRSVRVVLIADRTWQPARVLAGNADLRELSVQVVAVSSGRPPP